MTDGIEDIEVFGDGEAGKAARWISELELAERFQKAWHDKCKKIIARYTEEKSTASTGKRRFAVLWANQETLKPATYARPPTAVVLRRYKDADPVGRHASEVLERALNYTIDAYDFDGVMRLCRDDYLLCGRGISRVRYVPTIQAVPGQPAQDDDAGESITNAVDEEVTWDSVICDHVNYLDYGTNAARSWDEVRFQYFIAYMTRDELKERFTKKSASGKTIGELVPLDWKPEGTDDKVNAEQFNKARVYEIWDKLTKKAIWISRSYAQAPLDERDDPLKLKDFFPAPKALMATCGPDSIIPIPDYEYFRDQAEEVDDLTMRIGLLADALRMIGLYAAQEDDKIANLFAKSNENKMIPVDNWAVFSEKGGVKGMIEWVPVDMVIQVLKGLFEARKQLIDDIYQITGISDIMRGDTDPNETKGAQELKSSWGSSRVREKQKALAVFARDSLRIKAEIIASRFSIDTLKAMTNVQLLTNQEKQQITMAMQVYQQQVQAMQQMAQQQAPPQMPGQPPAPQQPQQQPPPPPVPKDKLELMSKPSWEDVEALLKSEGLRQFRIDVESDSTVEPDQSRDKKEAVEFVTALGQLLAGSLPVVQAAPPMGRLVAEIAKYTARRFNAGRELEDVIEQVMDEIGQMPPQQPPDQKGKSPEEIQMERERTQQQGQDSQLDHQARMVEAQTELKRGEQEITTSIIDAKAQQAAAAETAKVNAQRLHRVEQGRLPTFNNGGGQ